MSNVKSDASVIIKSAISAVLPGHGVRKALEEVKMPAGKVIVIAVGKAAYTMAKTCEDTIGSLIQSAASRLRSTIAALAGRASISGGAATSGASRITNVKVKSL